MIHVLGWSTVVLVLSGSYFLGKRCIAGFPILILADITMGLQALLMANWSILCLACALTGVHWSGWVCWFRLDRRRVKIACQPIAPSTTEVNLFMKQRIDQFLQDVKNRPIRSPGADN